MSEGDVSLIRDEDVLRRMWQQTEDFSRKKEIRAHMYRLREERLRNLYSPEPASDGKGCEFTSPQGHVKSFADQTFQSMKSKEVRDAGSPPKEFMYRGQDLKDLSNAGWNVESENRTTDDGHTHVKSVHANIEGKYDVEGGKGQFAAVDHHKQAVTEYQDDNTSLKRNESSSNTAAHEQVVRKTDDGTQFSSTTSSSTSTSKFQQVSSKKHETVPYVTNDDYDQPQQASYDTNTNEDFTRVTRKNDYEQSLRRNEFAQGELVSRKVEYPDDNTKVIVETRCLPDGTRVTSTKREFRAPVQSTRSEQHSTRIESKSYSSQQMSDTKQSTSKVIRHKIDNRTDDIVDSQRNVDDTDFKRQIINYSTTNNDDDYSDTQRRTDQRHETKVDRRVIDRSHRDEDHSQTKYETKINNKVIDYSTTDKDEYTQTQHRTNQKHYETNVDDSDRTEIIRTRDNRNTKPKDVKESHYVKDTEERTHHITSDKKVEEVVERKSSTDQYQTTYQTDFPQKKISNDWSPTHQAWASTLRSDTPSTTRPSTRASSPGSRTFKSSTSSLRSSVSPDKTYRKPSSRGGSPNKVDRFSPTRNVSDRYSSTHSTHSVTEVKTHRYTSPDRRPPTGRSPAGHGYSPDRKPQDAGRQRPSVSPEKRPQNFTHRPSASPERKPNTTQTNGHPKSGSPIRPVDRPGVPSGLRQSPEKQSAHRPSDVKPSPDSTHPRTISPSRPSPDKKPADSYPKDSSQRPSQSPDRKPGYRKPTEEFSAFTPDHPENSAPSKPYKPSDSAPQQPSTPTRQSPDKSTEKYPRESAPNRPSTSPDRKPGYMRPTTASQPIHSNNIKSPKPEDLPDRKSPTKHVPAHSPDRKPKDYTIKLQEDHYKFIDEETKMYTRTDKKDNHTKITSSTPERPRNESHSPTRKVPTEDVTDFCESPLKKDTRSPSPPKGNVTFTENKHYDQVTKTEVTKTDVTTTHDHTDVTITKNRTPKDKDTPAKVSPVKEPSPSKYGTYDKKKPHEEIKTTEDTTITKDTKDYDSVTRRDKSPPKKTVNIPALPSQNNPRDSISPAKSPSKDTKYKHTTDFIGSEKTREEINKKRNERPRQLITPSSSPTRKPKTTDTEPSTGQSSPTTSVSGFVYFGSPRTEKTIVTDLDDQEFHSEKDRTDETTTHKRPENLDVKRSPSPSKIPCKSPSPEKQVSPLKESLPRKSSLKKPSIDTNNVSPIEKPPSSFRVSPTDESQDFPGHKKEKSDKPLIDSPVKPKPPLERRETYEDRCRKILGMINDTTTKKTVTKENTSHSKEPESNLSSPSVSPCRSPAPKETSPSREYLVKKSTTDIKSDVNDFITHEKKDITSTTTTRREHMPAERKSPSRDRSPTKLHEIIFQSSTEAEYNATTEELEEKKIKNIVKPKHILPRESPEKLPGRQTFEHEPTSDTNTETYKKRPDDSPHSLSPRRPSESPERKPKSTKPFDARPSSKQPDSDYPRSTSPVSSEKTPRAKMSPERQPGHYDPSPTSENLESKPEDRYVRGSPTKKAGPDTTPGYLRTTTSVTSKYDNTSTSVDVQETILSQTPDKKNESPPGRPRDISSSEPSHQAGSAPNKHDLSPERKPSYQEPSPGSPKNKSDKHPKDSTLTRQYGTTDKTPVDIESTSIITSKNDTSSIRNTEEVLKLSTETRPTSRPSVSPPRQAPSDDHPRQTEHPRTISPTKPTHSDSSYPKRNDTSPDKEPGYQQPTAPPKGSTGKPAEKHPDASTPSGPVNKIPGYMRTTAAKTVSSVHETSINTDDIQETIMKTVEKKRPTSRPSKSPTEVRGHSPEHPRSVSPSEPPHLADFPRRYDISPERRPGHQQSPEEIPLKKTEDKRPKDSSPTRKHIAPEKTPGYMRTTESVTSKHDTECFTEYDTSLTIEDIQDITTKTVEKKHHSMKSELSPTRQVPKSTNSHPEHPKSGSPSNDTRKRHDSSPERKSGHQQPSKDSPTKKPGDKRPQDSSPTRKHNAPEKTPGYMRTTEAVTSKHDTTCITEYDSSSTIEDIQDTTTNTVEKKHHSMRSELSPTRQVPKSTSRHPEHPRSGSPSNDTPKRHNLSPERKPGHQQPSKDSLTKKPGDKRPQDSSPTRKHTAPEKTPGYMRTTEAVTSKHDTTCITEYETSSTIEDIHDTTIRAVDKEHHSMRSELSPTRQVPKSANRYPEHPKSGSPSNDTPKRQDLSPERKSGHQQPSKDSSTKKPVDKRPQDFTTRNSQETFTSDTLEQKYLSRSPMSPTRPTPGEIKTKPSYLSKPDEPRQLRTPSPTKKTTDITEVSTDFIVSEREQEVLDRVQKSLRKLSPERNTRSPRREKSPTKTTTSLQDIDITTTEYIQTQDFTSDDVMEITEINESTKYTRSGKPSEDKPKEQKLSKPPARNVSPIKKAPRIASPTKVDKTQDSPAKPRSISPKKPITQSERPQSPQLSKVSGIKPREPVHSQLTRKATPATLTTTKIERLTTDVKKTTGVIKQNILTKASTVRTTTSKFVTSPTGKAELEPKRTPTPKGTKELAFPKKDIDTKVTRTSSDTNMKVKKTIPQRMKSKPEIQVSDMSSSKTTTKTHKFTRKEPDSKLPNKPKSATALNTSTSDEDDIIIDVQQSKSSRENSPDRICPTPVNFSEDLGTPRFPDEVSEPDDDFRRRTHHTIHETESLVDDIVEISEDDELFVKRTNLDHVSEYDDGLLNVNEKVSKFTNKNVNKPRDATILFKETEKRVHSDYNDETLQSDECLLSVSEKVNKFAKGPRDTKDRSPSRRIVDEYDKDTIYQDDYTKLSVNDKAHLFVETAENVKVPKLKPVHKVERPDLTRVDDSLKSDDCLLSVTAKVNKFVKTAEQFMTETHEVDEKEKKIKEQHDKIMRQIVDDDDETDTKETVFQDVHTTNKIAVEHHDKLGSFAKETTSSHAKVKDNDEPNNKPTEKSATVKITTLRSSEAVKKAKALFENIASTTQKSKDVSSTKVTKLTDIGVIKKSPKTDSTTVLHPSVEDVSPNITDVDSEVDTGPHAPHAKDHTPSSTLTRPHHRQEEDKPKSSPTRLTTQSPEVPRSKSPMRHTVEKTTTKTVLSRYPTTRPESPKSRPDTDTPDKVPGYQRPTKTSLIKEETKIVEDADVSSRRGSGKFGVELRRTSIERSTVSTERRRSSVEHQQPCIEDIFDLDLLEQMLEYVVGYEQRRRIRSQIRVAKKESEHVMDSKHTKTTKQTVSTPKYRSPERQPPAKSPSRPKSAPEKAHSPERHGKTTSQKALPDIAHSQPKEQSTPVLNGHRKEPAKTITDRPQRPHSPEKLAPKSSLKTKSPVRHSSPDKKRTQSPSKVAPKPKSNRFNEYASAYMKKVGISEADKIKLAETKRKATEAKQTIKQTQKHETIEEFSSARSFNERTLSKDVIEVVQLNGKRSPSPEKRQSPERKPHSPERKPHSPERKPHSPERKPHSPERQPHSPERKPHSPERKPHSPERQPHSPERKHYSPERTPKSPTERLYQRTPSPEFKRQKSDTNKKETIIKTTHNIEKKIPPKPVQEEKPSWVTNRNLKKVTSETRTFSAKKIEPEKPKYRAASPSKVISKPIDVITSSYGPGPLDSDGKPLFGIKALRNGASNYQVKGTVIRQEFHSRNGGEPEGTVSVTAYSSEPEELERLLARQGEPPSRIHGLAAITTTRKFGGDTGTTLTHAHTKEDRASLEQFTHSDRRVEKMENVTEGSYTREEIADVRREEKDTRRDDRSDRNVQRSSEKVAEVKIRGQKADKVDDRREYTSRREDKKTVRQSSVKSLTEKYIKSANDSVKSDRSAYPKAGLILRTATMKDSVSSDSSVHAGLTRTDSEHSLGSADGSTVVTTTTERGADGVTTTTTRRTTHHAHHVSAPVVTRVQETSFLDSTTKVTGVQDILTRMKNADIVIQEGDSSEDAEARALLNKFLGATVLMAGMQNYVTEKPSGKVVVQQETVRSGGGGKVTSRTVEEFDLDQCWDERVLRKLLEECTDYEQRRRLRARIRTLMAEQEACASAVTEALAAAGEVTEAEGADGTDAREEEEVTVTSSVRRNSSEKTTSSTTTTKTSKVIESMTRPAPKPVSPFAKFRQLEKQNSTNSPNSAKSPQSPGSTSQPYFKFTDPALQASALTIKERLLQWCRDKTRDYENVKLENFSTSWADGLAFCALLHHFLPDAFDYSDLTPEKRRHNFTLAFKIADEKAGIYPLLDVDDMVMMRKPDWKCVFTYVQSIHRRFKDQV